eukprot:CAMPEP_0174754662 /NCGR_PEP_ID=MMETSP1094-20130205/105856_1 /TAXON_ID=156173 /ORGANISM="Chrysochromulina brevifilum, Strain UTEX LB 985" /LENGTH=346 /DNA_ID=CAMNT_0015960541 /DNA_START=139 /DNA_END=1179 /DNA_ORIENTATION=-
MSKPTMERRSSARLQRKEAAAPYSKSGSVSASGSTGLTSYMEKSAIDWDKDDDAAPSRSISMFGKKKAAAKDKLPPNWKKGKDKTGKVYYFNTITNQTSHEVPPPLPRGWREALHKDSGRVYYYHKETRKSTFDFPTSKDGEEGMDDDEMSEAEPPEPPSGVFGRTISKFTGKGKEKKKEEGISRSGTMSRGKKKEEDKGEKSGEQKTVFISCSTLIKEVKLCVEAKQHEALDDLFDKLTKHEIPAEQAVRQLMELVGSTVVQQAGLSVMNAQKGVLPHGWLEYIDEASGRPYYYNVHTKVTTWYKPSGVVPPPPPSIANDAQEEGAMVNLDCTLETHNVAMTGFI